MERPWPSLSSTPALSELLLQCPISPFVGTVGIGAKDEDVCFAEDLDSGTCRVLISPSIRCQASDCPRRARGEFWIQHHIRPASGTLHEEANCEDCDDHYHDGFNYCCQRHWGSPLLLRAEFESLVCCSPSAVAMGRCAGLSSAEFALLSGPSSTRRTMDSKYSFWSEVFLHDRRM